MPWPVSPDSPGCQYLAMAVERDTGAIDIDAGRRFNYYPASRPSLP